MNEIKILITIFILNQWSNWFWKLYDFIRSLSKPFKFSSKASFKSVMIAVLETDMIKFSISTSLSLKHIYLSYFFFLFPSFMLLINKISLKRLSFILMFVKLSYDESKYLMLFSSSFDSNVKREMLYGFIPSEYIK